MFASLPESYLDFMNWSWPDFEPYYQDLVDRSIDQHNVSAWLTDFSQLSACIHETYQRLYVAITTDTTDLLNSQRYERFLDEIYPNVQAAEQKLKLKLISTGLEPEGFAIPLRNMRTEAELFRQANLPLLSAELKLSAEYDKIIGAQTAEWEGQERTIAQLQTVFLELDRERRERAWRLTSERQLADRQAINQLWTKLMDVRGRLAANSNLPDYRAFRWRQLLRFDYTPQDCASFHRAIEEVVVPAAQRAYEKRRLRLGLDALRPWDLNVHPSGLPPLHPFTQIEDLEAKTAAIFHQVDPQLGAYFDQMRREKLMDLDNRKGKAPGGYCTEFQVVRRPFIFMNSVGIHDDVQTLLHEGGHAFHVFETAGLPYVQQLEIGSEIAELASMGMEMLSAPYLAARYGGFYSEKDAARARIEHLESGLLYWPYMAVVDAFQHWAYQNHRLASDPLNCDQKWAELWQQYILGIDWSGLDDAMQTGWQRKLHIIQVPFYYIEYGMAQLGAVQIWRNALVDHAQAVAAYRKALSLGGTLPLPQLYQAAGIKFAFDSHTLQQAVELIEENIDELSAV